MMPLSDPSQQQRDRWEQTTEGCRQRLQANPADAGALHQLGLVAREMGELEDAFGLIRRSLEVEMNNAAAVVDLADVLAELGRAEEAAEFYRAALENEPRDANLHIKLGNALGALGQWDEALKCQQKAVKLNPQSPAAHGNLGMAQQRLGDLAAAITSLRVAKRLAPNEPQIMANLGGCLVQAGRHDEAVEVLSRGVVKHPESAAAFSNLASAYTGMGRLEEATKAAWKALEIAPNFPEALNNLGIALKAKGEYPQAINCFSKARELQPNGYLAYNNLGTTLSEMGRSAEALEGLRHALQLCPRNPTVFSNYLLTLNYQPDVPRDFLFSEHQRYEALFGEPLRKCYERHRNEADPQRRLRIGYVSADLRDHPVANFVEPMLRSHSSAEFDVFCYANQMVNDAVAERLRGHVLHWRNVAKLSDAELGAMIRKDQIDILIDLSGHTAGNRLPMFARKPAPIQVTMIGYMQTTGLSAMDYRITDERIDPAGNEQFSSEKLIRLGLGAATFAPPADCPLPNALPALKNGRITFGSFNNLSKVTPEVVAAWAGILLAMPDARLIVVGREGALVLSTLLARGVPAERVEFIERLPLQEFLALHHRVDVLLDTFPYSGGTTNLLALWMGVPFVSMTNGTATGRAGVGLLESFGLPDFVAADPEDYVNRAVAAAGNLERLAELRTRLRPLLEPCLNADAFTREFETALREVWQRWCAEQAARV